MRNHKHVSHAKSDHTTLAHGVLNLVHAEPFDFAQNKLRPKGVVEARRGRAVAPFDFAPRSLS